MPPERNIFRAASGRGGPHYRAQLPAITLIVAPRTALERRSCQLDYTIQLSRDMQFRNTIRTVTEFYIVFARRGLTRLKQTIYKIRLQQITPLF